MQLARPRQLRDASWRREAGSRYGDEERVSRADLTDNRGPPIAAADDAEVAPHVVTCFRQLGEELIDSRFFLAGIRDEDATSHSAHHSQS